MSNKILAANPVTQTREAVESLLSWKGRAIDPMPEFVEMGKGEHRLLLVKSKKGDAYYTVTAKRCSCPSATFRPGKPCKHIKAFFNVATPEEDLYDPVNSRAERERFYEGMRTAGMV